MRDKKRRFQLNSIETDEDLLNEIAAECAKSNLELALTALKLDPKQIYIEYETDRLSFSWHLQGRDTPVCHLSPMLCAKEYAKVVSENRAVPQTNEEQTTRKFDVIA